LRQVWYNTRGGRENNSEQEANREDGIYKKKTTKTHIERETKGRE